MSADSTESKVAAWLVDKVLNGVQSMTLDEIQVAMNNTSFRKAYQDRTGIELPMQTQTAMNERLQASGRGNFNNQQTFSQENVIKTFFDNCLNGNYDGIRAMLSRGNARELVTAVDNNYKTGVHVAARNGHSKVVNLLLEWGSHVDAKDRSGRTPCSIACEFGRVNTVNTLLDRRTDPSTIDGLGRNCMHVACCGESASCAAAILHKHPNLIEAPDMKQRTPLFYAVVNAYPGANVALCTTMIDVRANVNACDIYGKSPLHYAAEEGRRMIVSALLKAQADPNKTENQSNMTPLQLAKNEACAFELRRAMGMDGPINTGALPNTSNQQVNYSVPREGLSSTQAPQANPQKSPARDYAGNPDINTKEAVVARNQFSASPNAELRDVSNRFAQMGISFAQLRDRFIHLMEQVQKYGVEQGEHARRPELFTGSWMTQVKTTGDLLKVLDSYRGTQVAITVFNMLRPTHLPADKGDPALAQFYGYEGTPQKSINNVQLDTDPYADIAPGDQANRTEILRELQQTKKEVEAQSLIIEELKKKNSELGTIIENSASQEQFNFIKEELSKARVDERNQNLVSQDLKNQRERLQAEKIYLNQQLDDKAALTSKLHETVGFLEEQVRGTATKEGENLVLRQRNQILEQQLADSHGMQGSMVGLREAKNKLEEELKLMSQQFQSMVEDASIRERKLQDKLLAFQGLNPKAVELEHQKNILLTKENELLKAQLLTYEDNLKKQKSEKEGLAHALTEVERLTKLNQELQDQLAGKDKALADSDSKYNKLAQQQVPDVTAALGLTEEKPAPKKETNPDHVVHGELFVKVISGHKLINTDFSLGGLIPGGKSDPYVKLAIPESVAMNAKVKEEKTKVINNNLDPMWNEELKFDINYEHTSSPVLKCKVSVWDDDTAGSNSMGRCDFELPFTQEHMKYSQQNICRRLIEEKKGGQAGFVKLQWIWKPTGTPAEEQVKVIADDNGGIPIEELEECFAATLWVRMISACGVRDADTFGTSDPYAWIEITPNPGSKAKKLNTKTATIQSDLNPIWNEELKLEINMPKSALPPTYRITIYDSDKVMGVGTSSSLGFVDVELPTEGVRKQVAMPLQNSGQTPPASVVFEYALLESGKELTSLEVPKAIEAVPQDQPIPVIGELTVRVVSGAEMPKMDMWLNGGLADPYCKVFMPSCAQQSKKGWESKRSEWKTKHIKNTLDPVWNEQHVFNVNFGSANPFQWPVDPENDPITLIFDVRDHDVGPGSVMDDAIGTMHVPLSAALMSAKEPCIFKLEGQNLWNKKNEFTGYMWVDLEWRPNFIHGVHADQEAEKDEHGIPKPSSIPVATTPLQAKVPQGATLRTPPNEICNGTMAFRFFSAYGLKKADWFGQTDAYFNLKVPVQREQSTIGRKGAKKAHSWKSKAIKGTVNPVWTDDKKFYDTNVVVRWIDKDGAKENYAEEKVMLSIMDKDTFTRDDALGKFVFPMPDPGVAVAEQRIAQMEFQDKGKEGQGHVVFEYSYIPWNYSGPLPEVKPFTSDGFKNPWLGILTINVQSANNLENTDIAKGAKGFLKSMNPFGNKNDMSDPFVRVYCPSDPDRCGDKCVKKETSHKKDTLNPTWNEELQFDINYIVAPADDPEVVISVWDYDTSMGVMNSSECLGEVRVPLKKLVAPGNGCEKVENTIKEALMGTTLNKKHKAGEKREGTITLTTSFEPFFAHGKSLTNTAASERNKRERDEGEAAQPDAPPVPQTN